MNDFYFYFLVRINEWFIYKEICQKITSHILGLFDKIEKQGRPFWFSELKFTFLMGEITVFYFIF